MDGTKFSNIFKFSNRRSFFAFAFVLVKAVFVIVYRLSWMPCIVHASCKFFLLPVICLEYIIR